VICRNARNSLAASASLPSSCNLWMRTIRASTSLSLAGRVELAAVFSSAVALAAAGADCEGSLR